MTAVQSVVSELEIISPEKENEKFIATENYHILRDTPATKAHNEEKQIQEFKDVCKRDEGLDLNKLDNISFLYSELMRKKLDLIKLEKLASSIKLSKFLKKKNNAKSIKLSLKSQVSLSIPSLIRNIEVIQKQNEIFSKHFEKMMKAFHCQDQSMYRDLSNDLMKRKIQSSDDVYKAYRARIGHRRGVNQSINIFLTSKTMYAVDTRHSQIHFVILLEEIDDIYVGAFHRWICITKRGLIELGDSNRRIEMEFDDPRTVCQLLMFLEITIRRRLKSMAKELCESIPKKNNFNIFEEENSYSINYRFKFSHGKCLEDLLPNIIYFGHQELKLISFELKEYQRLEEPPFVLGCWLVLWQNSLRLCPEDDNGNNGSNLVMEGYLMVCNTMHGNAWVPAYFVCRGGGILYQFHDNCNNIPQVVIKLNEYCVCRSIPDRTRPHAFELIKKDGSALKFAAPNEQVASQWLQMLTSELMLECKVSKKEEELKACQVILTTTSLVLCLQNDLFSGNCKTDQTIFEGNVTTTEHGEIVEESIGSTDSTNPSTNLCLSKFEEVTSIDQNDKISENNPIECEVISVRDVGSTTPSSSNLLLDCDRLYKPSIDEKIKVLALTNLDQVAEISVSSWVTNGCYIEFDCNEASEVAGDWLIYFPSEDQLSEFLNATARAQSLVCQKYDVVKTVWTGRINDLLVEYFSSSEREWK